MATPVSESQQSRDKLKQIGKKISSLISSLSSSRSNRSKHKRSASSLSISLPDSNMGAISHGNHHENMNHVPEWLLHLPPSKILDQPPFIKQLRDWNDPHKLPESKMIKSQRPKTPSFSFPKTPTFRKRVFQDEESSENESSTLTASDDWSIGEVHREHTLSSHRRSRSSTWLSPEYTDSSMRLSLAHISCDDIREESHSISEQTSSEQSKGRPGESLMLRYLKSYHPRILIEHCRKKVSELENLSPSVTTLQRSALLMADISGFTTLNEKFAKEGSEGVELVSTHLNHYFTQLLRILHEFGGDCVKVAGDALIVLFHDSELSSAQIAQRAVSCGLALQSGVGVYKAGGVELSLHIAIGCGTLYGFHVGGIRGEWEFFLAGAPFSQIEHAMDLGREGDVVVSGEVWEIVRSKCQGRSAVNESGHGTSEAMVVFATTDPLEKPKNLYKTLDAAEEHTAKLSKMLKAYTPRCVLEKLEAGMFQWLGEHRRATVLFVNLRGLELNLFGNDNAYLPHKALKVMQKVLHRYQGFRRQYLVDDKGSTFIAVFGVPPFAHEDDAVRAVKTALDLQKALRRLDLAHSIGVATGDVYVGSVGDDLIRREHAVVGDAVNTAARLSGKAKEGHILVDSKTHDHVALHFAILPRGPVQVKGRLSTVQTFEPHAEALPVGRSEPLQMFGRENELKMFQTIIRQTKKEMNSSFVWVSGSAGVGKTTLLQSFLSTAQENKFITAFVSGGSLTGTWILQKILQDLLGIHELNGSLYIKGVEQEEIEPLEKLRKFAQCLPKRLQSSASELFALFELQQSLEGPNHRISLKVETYIPHFVQLILSLSTKEHPCALFVDNLHHLPQELINFLLVIAKKLDKHFLLVVASRSVEARDAHILSLVRLPVVQKMRLRPLEEEQIRILVTRKLGVNSSEDSGKIRQLFKYVWTLSQGNPLFALETVTALQEADVIQVENGSFRILHSLHQQIALSYSLRKLLMGSFDTLTLEEQMICKLASLFGHDFHGEFLSWIFEHETKLSRRSCDALLSKLRGMQFFRATGKDSYAFCKPHFQQACYEMILFKTRARLHLLLAQHFDMLARTRSFRSFSNDLQFAETPDFELLLQYQLLQALRSGHRSASHALKALDFIIYQMSENLDFEHYDHVEALFEKALQIMQLNDIKTAFEDESKTCKLLLWEYKLEAKDIENLSALRMCHAAPHDDHSTLLIQVLQMIAELPRHLLKRNSIILLKVWKTCFFLGYFERCLEMCDLLELSMSESDSNYVDRNAIEWLIEAKRLRLWTFHSLGRIDDGIECFEETKSLLMADPDINPVTRTDILGMASLLFWVKGEHGVSRYFEKQALEVVEKLVPNSADYQYSVLHLKRWTSFRKSLMQDFSAVLKSLPEYSKVSSSESRGGSRDVRDHMIFHLGQFRQNKVSVACRQLLFRGASWDIFEHAASIISEYSLQSIRFGHLFHDQSLQSLIRCLGNVFLVCRRRSNTKEHTNLSATIEFLRLDLFAFAEHFDTPPNSCPCLVLVIYSAFVSLIQDDPEWTGNPNYLDLFEKILRKSEQCLEEINMIDSCLQQQIQRSRQTLQRWISGITAVL